MSMTRDEAIKHLRNDWFMSLGGQLCVDEDKKDAFLEAVGMGIKALRPVSRELVEKVWSGCPYCKEDFDGYVQKFGAYSIQNGELTTGHCKPQKIKFCPHCSRPLTDEAVEMVMERMEALHGEKESD